MKIGHANECVKIYKRALKDAVKEHTAYESLGIHMNLDKIVKEKCRREIQSVDRAIEVMDRPLSEIYTKYGMKSGAPKLTEKWAAIQIIPDEVEDDSIDLFKSEVQKCCQSPKFRELQCIYENGNNVYIVAMIPNYIKGRKDILAIFERLQNKYKCSVVVGEENGQAFITNEAALELARRRINLNQVPGTK